jgi:hypothetical protein
MFQVRIHGRGGQEVLAHAELLEVLGEDGAPPYRVRWTDDYTV